jgi:hypothetical protein
MNNPEISNYQSSSVFVSLRCAEMKVCLSYCQLSALSSDTCPNLLARVIDLYKDRDNLDERVASKFRVLPAEIHCFKSDKERVNESVLTTIDLNCSAIQESKHIFLQCSFNSQEPVAAVSPDQVTARLVNSH